MTPLTLAAGETGTLTFSGFKPTAAGVWTAALQGIVQGFDDDTQLTVATTSFEVVAEATLGSEITLTKAPTRVTQTIYNNADLAMTVTVKNTGFDYDGKMCIRFYSSKTSTADNYLVAEIENTHVQVAGGETAVVEISGLLQIPDFTDGTKTLYARAYYLFGDEMQIISTASLVTNRTSITVYPEQQSGIAEVTVDASPVTSANVFDLLGKRITLPADGTLRPGIYIIDGKKKVIR